MSADPPPHDLLELCTSTLELLCDANSSHTTAPLKTLFHSSRLPPISIRDYVARIAKYSKCSDVCLVIALVLMDRFLVAAGIPLSHYNVHRMCLTSVMVATKCQDDVYYSNSYYASIGGIPTLEMNKLELTFMTMIQWRTWVQWPEYEEYLAKARRRLLGGSADHHGKEKDDVSQMHVV